MTTSNFTKQTGFPASLRFLRKGDKGTLVCVKEHWKAGILIPVGAEVEGEISLLCPNQSYIAFLSNYPDSKVFKALYPLYPAGDVRETWKLKLKNTYLGGQLRSRMAKERNKKFQLNLLPE